MVVVLVVLLLALMRLLLLSVLLCELLLLLQLKGVDCGCLPVVAAAAATTLSRQLE